LLLAAAAMAAMALLPVPWASQALGASSGRPSLWQLLGPGGVRAGLGCAAAATALAAFMAVGGRIAAASNPHRGRPPGEGGQVLLEFVMVLPIALMLALTMAQAALLMAGHVCVHYAAYCAARAAIVQIPADLSPPGLCDEPGFEGPNRLFGPDASAKRRPIAAAAQWAVLPVSCGHRDAPADADESLPNALESYFLRYGQQPPGWVQSLARRGRYAAEHTRVEIEPPESGGTYGPGEAIRVAVEHDFYLSVPYAGRMFALFSGRDARELTFAEGAWATVMRAEAQLMNAGRRDIIDVDTFPRDY
jgi:hypothetical protein